MAKKSLILTIVVAIVVGALGFYGGIQYQKTKKLQFAPGQFPGGLNRPSGMPARSGFQGGRAVSGQIISVEDKTITVKTQDNSSKIVIYSDSTKVNKTSEGSSADLQAGETVMVIGSEGSDGVVTAQSIAVGGALFTGGSGNQ